MSTKSPRGPSFTVGLIQEAVTDDAARNVARATERIREAAARGAEIVCLQELFNSPYFCKSQKAERFDLAESISGPTIAHMQKLAKELEMVIVVPIFERQAAGVYRNSAAVIDADGSVLGAYRKMHIPDDPLFNEKYYFTPGDSDADPAGNGDHKGAGGFRVWRTRYADVGVLICWDQWYPEAARITSLLGAEIIFYPTAIGWHPKEKQEYGFAQHDSWELMQRSHAVANGCYVVSPNRIGLEKIRGENGKPVNPDGIQFWGQSFICQPNGQLAARASVDKEEILLVECDLAKVEFARTHWPFLRDRRVDAYGDMTKRFLVGS